RVGDASDRALGHDDFALGGDGIVKEVGGPLLAREVHGDGSGNAAVGMQSGHFDDDLAGPVGDGDPEIGSGVIRDADPGGGVGGDFDVAAHEADGPRAQ